MGCGKMHNMKKIYCLAVALLSLVGLAEELDLAGEWKLAGTDPRGGAVECPIAVPGGVHSALLAAGIIPDVYFGRNEEKTLWVARRDWTISLTFEVDEKLLAHKEVVLRLEDCDTICTVMVNGKEAGQTTDRFQRYTFDVKPYLKPGTNVIEGCFESPVNYADAKAKTYDHAYPISNPIWAKNQAMLRTDACHAGWDWGPEVEVIGFCGTVKLLANDRPRIDYVYTAQKFNDDLSHCTLTVFADLSDGTTVTNVVEIDDPPLWWPNGAGERKFFEYSLDETGHVISSDAPSTKHRVGLRKLEVLNEKTTGANGKEELSLVFRVNNRRLFMKGANWIPCDAYENRQTPEKYRDLLESAAAANMNMIRVWGGGQYEKDSFYDICDELGILLWHDMMFACAVYPADGRFRADITAELGHQLRRLRDHASIALWCGDNECLGAIKWFEETRNDLDFYRNQWIARSKLQDELVTKYDPTRVYWPSSPCTGPGDFGNAWKDDSRGDMHNWNVWHENKPFDDYYNFRPRFCSEFGYQSFPSMEIARTFASREAIESHGPDFEWHQKNPGGNRKIRETMARYFPAPKSVEAELLMSQFQHGMAMKMACEAWRAQRPRCMGTLFWQLNDNWPVASWSSIEYGGKWKSVQYMAKRFFAPLAVVGGPDGSVTVLNDLALAAKGEVKVEYWTYGGKLVKSDVFPCDVAADTALKVGKMAPPEGADTFAVLRLETDRGDFVNDWHFKKYCEVPLAAAKLKAVASGFCLEVSSDAPAFFVWANVPGVRGEFDDNAFTLLPGEKRTIVFRAKDAISPEEFAAKVSVVSLADPGSPSGAITESGLPKVKLADEIDDGRPAVRWRGFNLQEMLSIDYNPDRRGFREEDFKMISEWGFNFVRLPLDYRFWIKDGERKNWLEFDESGLKMIDAALELGKKYGLHVQLCLHRIPGYTSGTPAEPTDLFTDPESQRAACEHWKLLARRYRGIGNERLSFNLFNEPPYTAEEKYAPVAKMLIAAIRSEDMARYIIADGLGYGRIPVPSVDAEGVGVALRGYEPLSVTHYKTPWMKNLTAEPKWPVSWEEQVKKEWDDGFRPVREIKPVYADKGKEYLQRKMIGRFDDSIERGVFVYTGEFGVWKATPHKIALGLIEDYLSIWKERNIGWAMWDFRGAFGILDSGRADVEYEDYRGHKLDREMLELLRRY